MSYQCPDDKENVRLAIAIAWLAFVLAFIIYSMTGCGHVQADAPPDWTGRVGIPREAGTPDVYTPFPGPTVTEVPE